MVSIVIPAHNEEANIRSVVEEFYTKVVAEVEGSELIVVNDASTDGTARILAALQSEFPRLRVVDTGSQLGHGRSIRLGFQHARCDWLFYTDGDYQTRADELLVMLKDLDRYDFQGGIRLRRDDGFQRWVVTSVLRMTTRFLTGVGAVDGNCPYKLIRRSLWEKIGPIIPEKSLGPMICLNVVVMDLGVRTRFLPIRWHRRRGGRESVSGWWKWIRVGLAVQRDMRAVRVSLRNSRALLRS